MHKIKSKKNYLNIETELELVDVLASKLTNHFNTDVSIRELSAGYGIVDLVFAKNFVSQKNKINRPPINNYHALKVILGLQSKKEVKLADIISRNGISESTARKVLHYLVERNYLVKTGLGSYEQNIKLKNPIKKIVAIEAKLRDWKRGVQQARRYKSFTDECYLALLSNYEKNIDYDYVDQFGIGVIIFNPMTGEIIFKRRPRKNHFLSIHSELSSIFAKELFLYQLINN